MYPHIPVYSWSQLFLRSAAILLTDTCVSLPMHLSLLKTRGVKFWRASRKAWRCFRLLMFSPVCRAWYVYLPRYEVAMKFVIRTSKIVIWWLCQNLTNLLFPRFSSPGVLLVCYLSTPCSPSAVSSPL